MLATVLVEHLLVEAFEYPGEVLVLLRVLFFLDSKDFLKDSLGDFVAKENGVFDLVIFIFVSNVVCVDH